MSLSLYISKMSESKVPRLSNEETRERIEVEIHALGEGGSIESKFMGTEADRHDMTVLGRRQVLRVRRPSWISHWRERDF